MTMAILGNLRARQQVANSCKQEKLSLLLPNKDTGLVWMHCERLSAEEQKREEGLKKGFIISARYSRL